MRRFLQLVRSVPLDQGLRQGQTTSNLITKQQASRPFAISSALQAKRGDSTNESGSDQGGRKKGFLERASDKLSSMSGMESHPDQAKSANVGRQTRSSNQGGSSSTRDTRGGDAKAKNSKKASGKLGSHRALNSVKHDKESRRFTLDLGGNEIARIDYKPIGRNVIEMYHTEVPEHLRGRGIGKALAKGALECAAQSNLKLKITCEYLEDFVKRFADAKYRNLIEK